MSIARSFFFTPILIFTFTPLAVSDSFNVPLILLMNSTQCSMKHQIQFVCIWVWSNRPFFGMVEFPFFFFFHSLHSSLIAFTCFVLIPFNNTHHLPRPQFTWKFQSLVFHLDCIESTLEKFILSFRGKCDAQNCPIQ